MELFAGLIVLLLIVQVGRFFVEVIADLLRWPW